MNQVLTDDDLRLLDALAREVGIPEDVEPTPAQSLELLRRAPQDLAERLMAHWRVHLDAAFRCFVRNHDGEIAYWRDRAVLAEAALARRSRDPRPVHPVLRRPLRDSNADRPPSDAAPPSLRPGEARAVDPGCPPA